MDIYEQIRQAEFDLENAKYQLKVTIESGCNDLWIDRDVEAVRSCERVLDALWTPGY